MNDFTHPHFEAPPWLWLAVLGPVLLALLFRYAALGRRRQLAAMAAPHFVTQLTTSHSPARRRLKHGLLLVAVALIGLALARPQWGELENSDEWLGEDVLFALDCSRSMLATDIRPSRLQRAKFAILDFVRANGRGRVGVVAFAGGAFLQCPLTFDHDAFEDALLAIDEKTIPVAGTDIGRALKESDLAMDKQSRRKLIVLVTDGEDLEQGGLAMAKTLATNGVVVFTIGVGSPAGTEIQIVNAAGQPELLRDAAGEVVRSRLDEPTLRGIAEATGGNYFALGARGDGLAKVLPAYRTLQDHREGQQARTRGIERFHWPLTLALLLLAVERLLGTRRSESVVAATGGAVGKIAAAFLLALLCAVGSPGQTNSATNATAGAAIEPMPEQPREIYNSATRLLAHGKLADAEARFQAALATQDERVRAPAVYNLGLVRFGQGLEALEKEKSGAETIGRNKKALDAGDAAIREAQSSLQSPDVARMVMAYLGGQGARKELRAALKAVNRALEVHATALLKWRRAESDFLSAAELNPADTNALQNAKTVEREIAKLIDSLREMQNQAMMMGAMAAELKGLLEQLKGKIPGTEMPPGAAGEDGEEPMPEAMRGQQQEKGKEGREMEQPLSAEEAGRLLDGYRLGDGKRLPMEGRGPGVGKEGKNDRAPSRPW